MDDFVFELQNITDNELQEARQFIRKFPQLLLVKSYVKRPEILRDFIALVEDAYRDVHDADISMWLSNFIDTDDRLTPSSWSFYSIEIIICVHAHTLIIWQRKP
ncbi:MAG: hypothetical protein K0A90_07680 [Methanosarcinaceae archaeon]|nr:hypothetical protein [Methanosarcinaceae archaeon]